MTPAVPLLTPRLSLVLGLIVALAAAQDPNGPRVAFALDEASGSVAADATGWGNHGTLVGPTWSALGMHGGALQFDGQNDRVTAADSNALDLGAAGTMSVWVRLSTGGVWHGIVAKGNVNSDAAHNYALEVTPENQVKCIIGDGTSATTLVSDGSVAVGQWTHVACTWNGALLRIYLNASPSGSVPQGITPAGNGSQLFLGQYGGNVDRLNGSLDEVRVYARALTASEIAVDMNTPISFDSAPPTVAVTAPAPGSSLAGYVLLSATASDNVAVAGVQFRRNGINIGPEVTTPPFQMSWFTGAVPNGACTLTALARDAAGNATTSAPVGVTVANVPDTTPPVVAMREPRSGSLVSGTITISAYAVDSFPVLGSGPPRGSGPSLNPLPGTHPAAGVTFRIDGVDFGPEDTTPPFETSLNTLALRNGRHQIEARARDFAGNVTLSAPSIVSVLNLPDTTPPVVAITAPMQGAVVSGVLAVAASATDNIGVVGVQFMLDGADLDVEVVTPPWTVTWNAGQAGLGQHVLTARARDAAGNLTTSQPVLVNVSSQGGPALVGQWTAPVPTPVVTVHTIPLPNGKALIWPTGADVHLWDLATNTFVSRPLITDIFCAGHVILHDGRVCVLGGGGPGPGNATVDVDFFNPATTTWAAGPPMNLPRWYPTVITLPDARLLVAGGADGCTTCYVHRPEIYTPATNTWTLMAASAINPNTPNYPHLFVLADGRVAQVGASELIIPTQTLNLTTQTWTMVDSRLITGGSSVMYAPQKIMKTGTPTDVSGVGPSVATTHVIDFDDATPLWVQTAPMANPRAFVNLTCLPDGTVLATGGGTDKSGTNINTSVKPAELWSPLTQAWTTMAPLGKARLYHSTAVLLPDGRVLVSGTGYGAPADELTAEYFSPPYLFKGPRPTVTSSPAAVDYGATFPVATPNAAIINKVALIRAGGATHSFNGDQRFMNLPFVQTPAGLDVTAPANANVAPPGNYLLFILDGNGVPSIGRYIKLPITL